MKENIRKKIFSKLNTLSLSISKKLIKNLNKKKDFDQRNYYAKSFLAASLIKINKFKYEKIIRLLVKRISQEKKGKLYHYEFNRYALNDAFGSKKALKILNTNKFTYGKVANWSILRVICRFNESKKLNLISLLELIRVKILFQTNFGIQDQKGLFSTQYNFFSLALLNEIRSQSVNLFSNNWFNQSLSNCIHQINSNGVTNLIGRGSLQLFGYASLIYLLSFYSNNLKILKLLEIIIDTVARQINYQSVIPVVLFKKKKFKEKKYKGTPNLQKKDKLGWYSYNNEPDYSAFALLMFLKAKDNLSNNFKTKKIKIENNSGFRKIDKEIYCYKKNKILIYFGIQRIKNNECCLFNPIIINGQQFLLPPLGGEQSKNSLNNNTDFGLPEISNYKNKILEIKKRNIYNLGKNSIEQFIDFEKKVHLTRTIKILSKEIHIFDKIINYTKQPFNLIDFKFIQENFLKYDLKLKSNIFKNKLYNIIKKKNFSYSTNNLCNYSEIKTLLSPKEKLFLKYVIKI